MVNFTSKKHKAFSLPEILIVLVIIGFITVLMITQSKPTENLLGLQYRKVLHNLEVAMYNSNEECTNYGVGCHFMDTPENLCRQLTTGPDGGTHHGFINTLSTDCENRKFVSSNGAQYEIMAVNNITPDIPGISPMYSAIIKVDINGNRNPNTDAGSATLKPDIVYFVANSYGEVAPLGRPRFDHTYIQAKVVYPTKDLNDTSTPMPYAAAQSMAYGNTEHIYDIYSYVDSGSYVGATNTHNSDPYHITLPPRSSNCAGGNGAMDFPTCTLEIVY